MTKEAICLRVFECEYQDAHDEVQEICKIIEALYTEYPATATILSNSLAIFNKRAHEMIMDKRV